MWINRQVLDNDNWRQTSADLIADPAVQNTLSTYLVDQLYDNVDVAGAFEEQLPSDLKGLAAPLAGALRQPATRTVNRLLQSPRLQQVWINSSTAAHQKLVNVLENKTGNGIDTGNGNVTLDLHELLVQLGTTVGLPPDAIAKLPATAGTVTVMSSDQLSLAQTGVQIDPNPERLAVHSRPRPVRSGDLSGSRSAARDTPEHRLRVPPRRLARARSS